MVRKYLGPFKELKKDKKKGKGKKDNKGKKGFAKGNKKK